MWCWKPISLTCHHDLKLFCRHLKFVIIQVSPTRCHQHIVRSRCDFSSCWIDIYDLKKVYTSLDRRPVNFELWMIYGKSFLESFFLEKMVINCIFLASQFIKKDLSTLGYNRSELIDTRMTFKIITWEIRIFH